jgi:chorismate synthase
MKIERDEVQFRSGVRFGESLGSPITLLVENRDWKNWTSKMSPDAADRDPKYVVSRPRPGHADLTGALKYDRRDVRDVLERASARETTMRVAVGGLAKCLLRPLGIEVRGWVSEVGGIRARHEGMTPEAIFAAAEKSEVRLADAEAERQIIALVDECKRAGDTLGGVVEVRAWNVPPGLGSYARKEDRLDARLAAALMGIQAVKSVEVGDGKELASLRGSQAHDEIHRDEERGLYRETNRAGGIEGGISNGEEIVVRAAMKPLPTLMKPLASVDLETGEPAAALVERSDVSAVEALAVVAEAAVAWELARAAREKFGGDSLPDVVAAWRAYVDRIDWRPRGGRSRG